jgi:hypothetical protein
VLSNQVSVPPVIEVTDQWCFANVDLHLGLLGYSTELGDPPDSYTATLPPELTVNAGGAVTGKPTKVGEFPFTVTASNAGGAATGTAVLKVVSLKGEWFAHGTDQPLQLSIVTNPQGRYTARGSFEGRRFGGAGQLHHDSWSVGLTLATVSSSGEPVEVGVALYPNGDAAAWIRRPSENFATFGGMGWRNDWSRIRPARRDAGYYTAHVSVPNFGRVSNDRFGEGFITADVAASGQVTAAGLTPTGLAFTSSGYLSPAGRIPAHNIWKRPDGKFDVIFSEMHAEAGYGSGALSLRGVAGHTILIQGARFDRAYSLANYTDNLRSVAVDLIQWAHTGNADDFWMGEVNTWSEASAGELKKKTGAIKLLPDPYPGMKLTTSSISPRGLVSGQVSVDGSAPVPWRGVMLASGSGIGCFVIPSASANAPLNAWSVRLHPYGQPF